MAQPPTDLRIVYRILGGILGIASLGAAAMLVLGMTATGWIGLIAFVALLMIAYGATFAFGAVTGRSPRWLERFRGTAN